MVNEKMKNIANELHEQIYSKIYDNRDENYDEIQKGILASFRNLLKKINLARKEVGYINVSILRSSIKNSVTIQPPKGGFSNFLQKNLFFLQKSLNIKDFL